MPCSWSQYLSRASSHCGRMRGGQTPGHLAPPSCPSASLVAPRCEVSDCQPQMPKGKGRELEGEEAAGRVGLGRGRVEAQVAFGAGHGT